MGLVGEVRAEIVAGVDQASFNAAGNKIQQFARDTGKKLDQTRHIKLEANVANATIKLQQVRAALKRVGDDVAKKRELIIETNRTQSNLTEAKRKLQNFRNTGDETASRLQTKFAGIGKNIVSSLINPVTIAVTGIYALGRAVVGAVDSFREFDKVQRQLQSIAMASGSTATAVKKLEQNALDLGAATKFTAAEVSGLQLELTKLGFGSEEILKMTESTLNLAGAFGTDLGETAKVTGATLKIFGLEASETTRVNDVLAKSFASSGLDLTKFGVAITKVGPVAKTFGFSLEETTALLGSLATAGFDASSAGTATRSILLNLADANGKLAQELGRPIESVGDLTGALRELQDRFGGGASGAEKLAKTLELTDKRSVAAFNNLLDGTVAIDELAAKLENAGGTAEKLANEQLKGIDGALTLMSSAIDGAAIKLGAFLAPAIIQGAKFISFLTTIGDELWTILQVLSPLIGAISLLGRTFFPIQNSVSGLTDRIDETKASIESLNEQLANGEISAADYVAEMLNLQTQLESLQATYEVTNDTINANNEKIADNEAEMEKNKQTLVNLNGALQRGAGIQSLVKDGIAKTTEKMAVLKEESRKLKLQNDFLSGSFGSVNAKVNSISTAKTRGEFIQLRHEALLTVQTLAKIGIAQLALARDSGDQVRIDSAKKSLGLVRSQLQAVKDLKFTQTSLTGGVVTNNKELTKGLKIIQQQAAGGGASPTSPGGGGGGGGVSRAKKQEEKKTADLKKELEKRRIAEHKTLEDIRKDREKNLKKLEDERKKLAKEDQKILDDFAKTISKSYDNAEKAIEKTTSKIEKLNDKIADTKSKILELDLDAGEDIATRAVAIEEELKSEDLDPEKELALKKELALAEANITDEQRARAELLAGESETEKIIRETAEKKAELENQLLDLETQKATETQILADQTVKKEEIEAGYTKFFGEEIDKREKMSLESFKRIADARARLLGGDITKNNNTSTSTKNVTINANISNTAQADSLIRKVSI